jgi:hypothetical protein
MWYSTRRRFGFCAGRDCTNSSSGCESLAHQRQRRSTDADQLPALAGVGLVAGPDSSGRWTAVGRGLYLDIPKDSAALAEVRGLVGIMLLDGADAPRRWVEDESPRLEPEWMAASGRLSVRVALTPDELNEIQAALERVLEPYLNRSAPVPDTAREVQILSYFLPRSAP